MKKEIFDENNGLWYTLSEDGMYYPNIEIPEEENVWVGKYGLLRETYLREHKHSLYMSLYLSGRLNKHLLEINEQAQAQVDQMAAHWAKLNRVNEDMKANNQMEWVARMSNYRLLAEEVVYERLIFTGSK